MEILPILSDSYTLGFIGAGKMAESIAKGASRSGVLPSSRIVTAHSNPSRRAAFESIGITVLSSNDDVVRASNVVVFSVKPQLVKDVVLKLKPLLTKDKLLVSVAAGIKLKDLQEWAGHGRFIRVMPNTPAAVGQAASAVVLAGGGHSANGVVAQGSQSEGDSNNTTIFVGGLDSEISDEDLRQPFLQYGDVVSVKIPIGKGCGFVQLADRKNAEEAIQGLNGTVIGKQTVRLSWGRSPGNKHWRNND
ncbi:pyrroline-5-carboxylate reductase-like [Lathyrus oleraceus]|uniref:pyrroline-5-carboxylate reductase-like n=1 Tax=Pisum sativum TaxID=3888 RepID=UPI0021D20C44|nr:pyrroline-5-carboxylate reductase-like [Pisum sativum]